MKKVPHYLFAFYDQYGTLRVGSMQDADEAGSEKVASGC